MKKFKRFFIVGVCIICAICQFASISYSYTIDEVKRMIGYKIIEGDNEPEDFDVEIDANEMIQNEKLPCIQTTIEKILYGTKSLFNIDFLGSSENSTSDNSDSNSSNKNSNKNKNKKNNNNKSTSKKKEAKKIKNQSTKTTSESDSSISADEQQKEEKDKKTFETIRDLVRTVFKVSLYIAIAIMLTLLLYMSVVMVMSAVSGGKGFLPYSNVFDGGNIDKSLKAKRLVNQWFASLLILASLVYIINIITSFAEVVGTVGKVGKIDKNNIGVFVKNSEIIQQSSVNNSTMGTSVISQDIESILSDTSSGGNWSVYAENLKTGSKAVLKDTNQQMSSASVIKLFIAAAAYSQQKNTFYYKVNENDMKLMISNSDNNAANRIIKSLGGYGKVNKYLEENKYSKTELNRNFGITVYSKDNLTCANDVAELLKKIYNDSIPGAGKILGYMKDQTHRSKIPAGVPSNVTVANKTGELGSDYRDGIVENDAAIVYKEDGNYILVIMSSKVTDDAKAIEKIKKISSRVYETISSNISGGASSTNSNSIVETAESNSLRQKVIDQAKTMDNLGAPGGYCEMWVEAVYRKALGKNDTEIPRHCCAHQAGIDSIVSNSSENIVPGAAVFSFRSSSGTHCNGIDAGHVGIYVGNGQIISCTGRGETGVVVHTIDEWKSIWDFSGWGWLAGTESIATGATSDGGVSSGNKLINYYFETNIEGLMMFQSQFDWTQYTMKNAVNIIGGIAITVFKYVLVFVFVLRTLILALITAISPLIVLLNAYIVVTGSKGFLGKWLKFYFYLIFIRPVVSLLYYILVQDNVYLASEVPLYVAVVAVILTILVIRFCKKFCKEFSTQVSKSRAERRVPADDVVEKDEDEWLSEDEKKEKRAVKLVKAEYGDDDSCDYKAAKIEEDKYKVTIKGISTGEVYATYKVNIKSEEVIREY